MTKTERALARGKAASADQDTTQASSGDPQSPGTDSPPAAAKRKGGPVPGTPSPMRTRMTPELLAHVKRLYEETDQHVCATALDCGVDESTIRRLALREGWVRYVAPPRDLPPVATLLAQVEALEEDRQQGNPPSFEGGLRPPPQDDGDNIERFIRVVMAHLDEFEAVRRAGKLIAREHLPTARAISILTEAFNKLQRLRAAQPGTIHDDLANADMPADLDAFREALAQRIENFLASRTDAGAFADPAAEPAEGA